jgi:ubiquinone/menaquinone biosynthesis C-methylase UbiE
MSAGFTGDASGSRVRESATPWSGFCCPDCRGPLEASTAAGRSELRCVSCGANYALYAGIPGLIGKKSALNQSEVETQDRVSDDYAGVRYQRAGSVRYHEDTMAQLVELGPPRGAVLDAGCGIGSFLEFLLQRSPAARYVGIDVSRGMLGHAARQLGLTDGGGGAPVQLAQADACRLPFADATFDVVYARGLLHHLPEPSAGIREIRRVLRPGGTALLLDPNKTLISELPRRLANRSDHFDADHKNFRAAELERWVSAELSIVETRFFGYVAYPLLGFPDLIDFERLGIGRLAGPLISADRLIARVPFLRRLGWGVIIAATRRD